MRSCCACFNNIVGDNYRTFNINDKSYYNMAFKLNCILSGKHICKVCDNALKRMSVISDEIVALSMQINKLEIDMKTNEQKIITKRGKENNNHYINIVPKCSADCKPVPQLTPVKAGKRLIVTLTPPSKKIDIKKTPTKVRYEDDVDSVLAKIQHEMGKLNRSCLLKIDIGDFMNLNLDQIVTEFRNISPTFLKFLKLATGNGGDHVIASIGSCILFANSQKMSRLHHCIGLLLDYSGASNEVYNFYIELNNFNF